MTMHALLMEMLYCCESREQHVPKLTFPGQEVLGGHEVYTTLESKFLLVPGSSRQKIKIVNKRVHD